MEAARYWFLDTMEMKKVVARIHLPQTVAYGFHGTWFTEQEVLFQGPWEESREEPRNLRIAEWLIPSGSDENYLRQAEYIKCLDIFLD